MAGGGLVELEAAAGGGRVELDVTRIAAVEWADGRITIHVAGCAMPFQVRGDIDEIREQIREAKEVSL